MEQIEAADELGIRLEITEGLPTWEFHPNHRHQATLVSLVRSVRPRPQGTSCACYPTADVLITFPDGSLKRPDLAIFCAVPKEWDEAIRSVPAAVVEIVSRDSKRKDYDLNPPFYLKHGVLDVLVIDPLASTATWFTSKDKREIKLGQTVELQSGCLLDI